MKSVNVVIPCLAVVLALAVCFGAIAATGKDPVDGYSRMFGGGLRWPGGFGESVLSASTLILTGLSVGIALRAGLFNVGAEGQFLVGAITAAVLGWKLGMPPVLGLPLIYVSAGVFGGLFAAIAGFLKAYRGVHEVISTIMLNFVAIHLIESWLVVGPLSATLAGAGGSEAGTPLIQESFHLFRPIEASRLDIGIAVSLVAAFLVTLLIFRMRMGFEIRAVGANSEAAHAAGIPVARRIVLTLFVSGFLAGVAGAQIILSTEHRYPGVFQKGHGFDGIAIALLGGNHPVGICAASLFFGVIRAGATKMQIIGIHRSFADMIQGLAVLFVAGHHIWRWVLSRGRRSAS